MKNPVQSIIQQLKDEFDESDSVWFFVDLKYRIVAFNKKAAANSVTLHKKEIYPGASILDYARDTKNRIDSEFIRCFGKAATGQQVELEQEIRYNAVSIFTKATYTPVMQEGEVIGLSILVSIVEKAG